MSNFTLSPLARADLQGIWKYSAEHWSVEQADRYLREIHQEIEIVARDPTKGRPCNHLRPGYRMRPTGSQMLFFRLTDRVIHVVRILHQRMDFERHL